MTRFERICPRLPTADLARIRHFYEDTLGFATTVLWPDDEPAFCMLGRGAVEVAFFTPSACAGTPAAPAGGVELYIEVDDAAALATALAKRVAIEWGPEVYDYGRREFGFRDPDGNLVIITQRTDDPPDRLTPPITKKSQLSHRHQSGATVQI